MTFPFASDFAADLVPDLAPILATTEILAARSGWSGFFTLTTLVIILASTIRLAVPYIIAAVGESIGQRSGVLNLGVDGVMLLGAFAAYYVTLETGSPWQGLGMGLLVGMVMGLLYAFITVTLHAQQGISGIGIYLFGLGFSDLLWRQQVGTPLPIRAFQGLFSEHLSFLVPEGRLDIPYPDLYDHSIIVYLAFLLVPLATLLVTRTTFGLNIRAVGETPEAADSLGVSVARTRYATIIISNALAGLAGAALALERGIFIQNITNGLGFIAVALVYFGAWRPLGVMLGSLLFSLVTASVLQLKTLGILTGASGQLTEMAPAAITIVALVVVTHRIGQPSALTKPFSREADY